jgi:hypothetical protein
MRISKLISGALLLSATTAYADICADMSSATAGAVSQRQQEVDRDPRFEEIERQRQADQKCMLDLSKELGGVVSADGYGLGAIIDDVFKQVSASLCNVQNNPARQHAGFSGSITKAPQQAAGNVAPSSQMPSINGALPSANPLATPSIIQQPTAPSSSSSNVWSRLNEAMAGRPINK